MSHRQLKQIAQSSTTERLARYVACTHPLATLALDRHREIGKQHEHVFPSIIGQYLLCILRTFLDIRDIMCKLYTGHALCFAGGSPTDELR